MGDNKMAIKKHSAFALLDILIKYTDENHLLTAREIINILEKQYDLTIERRTLYSNIEILEQAGYKISKYEDNGKGYFLEEKQFDKAEILLLCDALHASHFISEKQSNNLINKLLSTLSKYEANEFTKNVYLPNLAKITNKELFYNISLISEAIRDEKMLQFIYTKYDTNKKLVNRRDEPYIVEARYIVYNNTKAYLIATSPKHNGFIHFRIDRIIKATITEERSTKLARYNDPYEYAKDKLFMYGGNAILVSFFCDERVLDMMIDIFGKEVSITKTNDNKFILDTRTSKKGAKLLAQQYLDSIKIIKPIELKNEFIEELNKALLNYQIDN